jgi:hypothetical protein
LSEGTQEILVVDTGMTNNTAEGQINIVYPYKLEAKIVDITA